MPEGVTSGGFTCSLGAVVWDFPASPVGAARAATSFASDVIAASTMNSGAVEQDAGTMSGSANGAASAWCVAAGIAPTISSDSCAGKTPSPLANSAGEANWTASAIAAAPSTAWVCTVDSHRACASVASTKAQTASDGFRALSCLALSEGEANWTSSVAVSKVSATCASAVDSRAASVSRIRAVGMSEGAISGGFTRSSGAVAWDNPASSVEAGGLAPPVGATSAATSLASDANAASTTSLGAVEQNAGTASASVNGGASACGGATGRSCSLATATTAPPSAARRLAAVCAGVCGAPSASLGPTSLQSRAGMRTS
mmetsp:Transcript_46209/g.134535  ORF Transcript_46209/g.134535 Transcript_46209/m.134535 type:complete len:315 (+) Transcript_46209:800-1744(+)